MLRLREVRDSPKDTQRGLDQGQPKYTGRLAPVQLHNVYPVASKALSAPTPTPVMEPGWVGLATERLQAWLGPAAHGNWAIFLGRK